ncbi:hypothetical protein FLL45_01640 [Aliikangiella marina]|uniref:Uncharacterized protein n=1 Tax=Aliikangiella marina TaxID=1712262 RepID=A0A545THI7_9GAMM|nr:hypothetical protein [Aliikangiella marina]TQV76690.1 hypothetical protein FLL45_01640 [Aliikangiella marina]
MEISQPVTTALTELERLKHVCLNKGYTNRLDDIAFLRGFLLGLNKGAEHKVLNALKNVLMIEAEKAIKPESHTALMMTAISNALFIDGYLEPLQEAS